MVLPKALERRFVMYKVRIKFSKIGLLKYISHLDTMRLWRRAFQKAGIPVEMSQGFNPHPKFSMAQALGIGVESYGEYLDVELSSKIELEEMKMKMNQVLPGALRVIQIAYIGEKEKPGMSVVAASSYRVQIKWKEAESEFQRKLMDYLGQEEIKLTQKRKKDGRWQYKEKDIRQGILSCEKKGIFEDMLLMDVLLSTGSKLNIRIDDFVKTLCQYFEMEEDCIHAVRTELFQEKEGTELELIPLIG